MNKNKKETCKNENSFCIRLESPYFWDKRTREVLLKNFQYATSSILKEKKKLLAVAVHAYSERTDNHRSPAPHDVTTF